ncbi:MAG TPA: peptidoglycan DD-metalloendopeptidase family protein [Herpetosiphonaceae bacterium]|nr:peptidoglycan DD-metalloendopeptidase family protein [Herpetosiphonaceae bacterium]
MARYAFRPHLPAPASGWRRAWNWDRRLPRPLLILLLLDLLLLAPIPFLLPAAWNEPAAAPEPAGLAPLVPRLSGGLAPAAAPPAERPQENSLAEAPAAPPLLIDPVRLQDASFADANTVAAILAHLAPDLAGRMVAIGGGLEQPVASVLTGQALRWNLNPLVLLALLETQGGLLSPAAPPTATLDLAMRGPSERSGLGPQITWAATELRAGLLEPISPAMTLADGSIYTATATLDQANYALLRLLARTHSAAELDALLGAGPRSWAAIARRVMGDPRSQQRLRVIDAPFLRQPFAGPVRPIARFDHQYPVMRPDGAVVGNDQGNALGYDGHNGWDYELAAGAPVLAAATGRVLFAGWMDNECATPAGVAVMQHANGYRTAYWHLERVDVGPGDELAAGAQLGLAGHSGCAVEPHLHFSVQRLGRDVDPAGWCQAGPDPWAGHPAGASSRWLWADQPDPCALSGPVLVADDSDAAATLILGEDWRLSTAGNYGGSRWASAGPDQAAAMIWRPATPLGGRYEVSVFVPNTAADAGVGYYHVAHGSGEATVAVAQSRHAGSWVRLGVYGFGPGQTARISLRASESTPGAQLWFDAVALQPESAGQSGSGE